MKLCMDLNRVFNALKKNGGNVGILQSLHQMGPKDAHMRRERTPYASLLGPIETI